MTLEELLEKNNMDVKKCLGTNGVVIWHTIGTDDFGFEDLETLDFLNREELDSFIDDLVAFRKDLKQEYTSI